MSLDVVMSSPSQVDDTPQRRRIAPRIVQRKRPRHTEEANESDDKAATVASAAASSAATASIDLFLTIPATPTLTTPSDAVVAASSSDATANAAASTPIQSPAAVIASSAPTSSTSSFSDPSSVTCPSCGALNAHEYSSSIGLYTCLLCGCIHSSSTLSLELTQEWDDKTGKLLTGSYIDHSRGQQLSHSAKGRVDAWGRGAHTNIMSGLGGSTQQQSGVVDDRGTETYSSLLSYTRMNNRLHSLLSSLNLPHSIAKQVVPLVLTTTGGTHGTGSWSIDLILGASVYALCRLANRSLTLIDVCEKTTPPCNVHVLAKVLSRVVEKNKMHLPVLDPTIFIERALNVIALSQSNHGLDMIIRVRREINSVLKLAHHDWLDSGRMPAGLCGAAVSLVLKVHEIPYSLSALCEELHVSEKTFRARVKELTQSLFNLATKHIPWLLTSLTTQNKSNKKSKAASSGSTIDTHMKFIIEQLDVLLSVQQEEMNAAMVAMEEKKLDAEMTPLPVDSVMTPVDFTSSLAFLFPSSLISVPSGTPSSTSTSPVPHSTPSSASSSTPPLLSPCTSRSSSQSTLSNRSNASTPMLMRQCSMLSSSSSTASSTSPSFSSTSLLTSLSSDPPSFKRSILDRTARRNKLIRVVRKIQPLVMKREMVKQWYHELGMSEDEITLMKDDDCSNDDDLSDDTIDTSDRLISQLLLSGVSINSLIDTPANQFPLPISQPLHIEDELTSYIRTQEEVQQMERLRNGGRRQIQSPPQPAVPALSAVITPDVVVKREPGVDATARPSKRVKLL